MSLMKTPEVTFKVKDIFNIFFGSTSVKCRSCIRMGQFFRARGYSRLAKLISRRLQRYGLFISHNSVIHKTVKFPHPTAIVIGSGVLIEENVRIFQNTTLGGARIGDYQANNYPTIGAGTVIFAGSVIVGKIRIGRDCVIGANSVVLSDVPDGSVCVGAPAKVITKKTSNYNERT